MAAQVPVLTEEIRRQFIGAESPPVTVEVEKGAIQKFAEAVGDLNRLYTDEVHARGSRYGGIIAPPTFLRSIRNDRPELPGAAAGARLLDAGSEWEYFCPARAGDRITAVVRVAEAYERQGRLGRMIFVVYLITYTNQLQQVVATQKNTTIKY